MRQRAERAARRRRARAAGAGRCASARLALELGMRREPGAHDVLVLLVAERAGRVDDHAARLRRAASPPRGSRAAARRGARGRPGSRRQRISGCARSVPSPLHGASTRMRSKRAAANAAAAARASSDERRDAARARAGAAFARDRARAAAPVIEGDDEPAIAHELGERTRSCRRARRRRRGRACRAAGRASRATSCDASPWTLNSPVAPARRARAGRRRRRAPRPARSDPARTRRRPPRRRAMSAVAFAGTRAQHGRCRLVVGGEQRARSPRAEARLPALDEPSRMRERDREMRASGRPRDREAADAARSRTARRRTAFTRPPPRPARAASRGRRSSRPRRAAGRGRAAASW